jgi:hypothetical protein
MTFAVFASILLFLNNCQQSCSGTVQSTPVTFSTPGKENQKIGAEREENQDNKSKRVFSGHLLCAR